jgi:hypothetical protein
VAVRSTGQNRPVACQDHCWGGKLHMIEWRASANCAEKASLRGLPSAAARQAWRTRRRLAGSDAWQRRLFLLQQVPAPWMPGSVAVVHRRLPGSAGGYYYKPTSGWHRWLLRRAVLLPMKQSLICGPMELMDETPSRNKSEVGVRVAN